jgi:hypothetical protein
MIETGERAAAGTDESVPGADESVPAEMRPGTEVEVRRRFDRQWARGFEVSASGDSGYWVRRTSDDTVLPVEFSADDVRVALGSR